MKLSQLLLHSFSADFEIQGIHYDSRKIKPGYLFFAVPGFTEDGTKYIEPALKNGAVAVVVANGSQIPAEFSGKCIEVPNIRKCLAETASAFYGFPHRKFSPLVGVTGTKGKTSTTFLIESILRAQQKHPALIGGVECRYENQSFPSKLTTLDSLDLQRFLAEAVSGGAKSVSMEVSSHALSLDRVWSVEFDGLVFTNLSEDHLDFYADMEKYFEAKKMLFMSPYRKGPAAANIENKYGQRIVRDCPGDWVTFGLSSGDVHARNVHCTDRGIQFILDSKEFGSFPIQSSLAGEFNIINILGAAAICLKMGMDKESIAQGILDLKSVPGRIERVETTLPISVFVDFAHMGLALENVLHSLRPLCTGRLILVVGAGGDRPVERRIQLGGAAAKMADYTFITSDNPRTENPDKIIAALERAFLENGGKKENYIIEADRKKAIQSAIRSAKAGDVICLAGKGHETGQIIGTTTYPFDDRVEAAQFLREAENNIRG